MFVDGRGLKEEQEQEQEKTAPPTMDSFGSSNKYKSKYQRSRENISKKAAGATYELKNNIKDKITHEREANKNKAYEEARYNRYNDTIEKELKQNGVLDSEERNEQERLKRQAIHSTENNTENSYSKDGVDSYTKWISKILTNLEEVYGLQATSDGVPLYAMDIKDLHSYMITRIKKNNKELNGKAGKYIVELSYLGDRLEFFSYNRVDFAKYKFLETILPILRAYTTSTRVKAIGVPNSPKNVTKILAVLQGVEADSPKFKKAIGYRLLRLFAILVYHNNIIDAGIVAKFIITQMALANVGGATKGMVKPDTNKYVSNRNVKTKNKYVSNRKPQY